MRFFRLELNFKRIFWCNVLVSLAYTAAAFPFATESLWPMVFLIGEGAGLLYVSLRTPFVHEPCRRTPLFGETAQKAVVFMLSSLVGNLLLYADRMIIYPVLGPESVSYYSTASFFGKSAGIVMTPIAGVLLGYFAQKSFRASPAAVCAGQRHLSGMPGRVFPGLLAAGPLVHTPALSHVV